MSTFFIQQFGCRATQADGAAIERQLREQGCAPAPDSSTADVVVLNTCTVTAAADAQARDAIRKIRAGNRAAPVLGAQLIAPLRILSDLPSGHARLRRAARDPSTSLVDFSQKRVCRSPAWKRALAIWRSSRAKNGNAPRTQR